MLDLLIKLEKKLYKAYQTQDIINLNLLMADDFYEFSCSGKKHIKYIILKELPKTPKIEFKISQEKIIKLSEHSYLLTYLATIKSNKSFRSSIWQKNKSQKWQIKFHQGTIVK